MPSSMVIVFLIVGLVAQLLGVILIVVDVVHNRKLTRQYQDAMSAVEQLERDNEDKLPLEDIEEDLKSRVLPIGVQLDAMAANIKQRNEGSDVPSAIGVALLVMGILANFVAAIGPLL